jgi:hypothetical protein
MDVHPPDRCRRGFTPAITSAMIGTAAGRGVGQRDRCGQPTGVPSYELPPESRVFKALQVRCLGLGV